MTEMIRCHVTPISKEVTVQDLEPTSTIRLALSGLGCINCANRVRNALLSCPSVVDAKVDLGAAQADVWYLPEHIGPLGLTKVVSLAGKGTNHQYRAVPAQALFPARLRHA
jgi:copper chaperone CopZ